ncbi:hypothetical protein [Nocardia brasiliensis]|nr:hypothetical protein [Nocardia brasiliensis]
MSPNRNSITRRRDVLDFGRAMIADAQARYRRTMIADAHAMYGLRWAERIITGPDRSTT